MDTTGQDILLEWVLEALDASTDLAAGSCMNLPRLNAYMAALLTEPKHLHGELGVQFQAYVESCQLRRTSPKGREMLQMIAKRFQLDLNRGSNLTQQAPLELTVDSYAHEGLQKFIERIELVLNAIPPTHQPSEMTKFIWLFSRLKPCRMMQRFIDRIKDSKEGSHTRSWDWWYGKLKGIVIEMREDQIEASIKASLQTEVKNSPRSAKAAVASKPAEPADETKGLPGPAAKAKPKAKAKSQGEGIKGTVPGKSDDKSKGKSKGDGKGKDNKKGSEPAAKPKAGPKAKSSIPSLFYPKGTCNRGDNCPFLHAAKAAAAAKAKSSAATAKATVAFVAAAYSMPKVSAVSTAAVKETLKKSAWATFKSSVSAFVQPFLTLMSLTSGIGDPQGFASAATLCSPNVPYPQVFASQSSDATLWKQNLDDTRYSSHSIAHSCSASPIHIRHSFRPRMDSR